MAKAFLFKLGQRLNVPGLKDVQGVVTLPCGAIEFAIGEDAKRDTIVGEDCYFLRWLSERGRNRCGWFGEVQLSAANVAQEPVPAAPVMDMPELLPTRARRKRRAGTEARRHAARPKRKPARKAKRKA